MARILPDANDVIVWRLDEAAPPFVNSSTSPNSLGSAVDFVTVQGFIAPRRMGPFSPSSRALGILTYLSDSTYATDVPPVSATRDIVATNSGSNTNVPAPMSVSGWAKFNTHSTGYAYSFTLMKRPTVDLSTSPVITLNVKSDGEITFAIVAGSGQSAVASVTNFPVPFGVWCHLGLTYDGNTLNGYLNGELAGQSVRGGAPVALSYASNGPWSLGAATTVGNYTRNEPACYFADWRVADIVRDEAYFRKVYRAGTIV